MMSRDTILLVKLSTAINDDNKSAYEATRGNWKIRKSRIEDDEILYVGGLETQERKAVVGLYEPEIWYQVVKLPEEKNPEILKKELRRYCFDGKEAPVEILEKLNKVYPLLLERYGPRKEKTYITLKELDELLLTVSV